MNELLTAEFLGTFAGLVAGTGLVVQALKYFVDIHNVAVRVVTVLVAIVLTFAFNGDVGSFQSIILTILNGLLVALTASGAYEYISDPYAKK